NVNRHYFASLPHAPNATGQLLLDLSRLNEETALADGSVPFKIWLEKAEVLTTGSEDQAVFQAALNQLGRTPEGVGDGLHSSSPAPSPPRERRRHFLDEIPFDFSRPESQALWALLEENIYRVDDVIALLDKAGVSKARLRLEVAPHTLW